jgi:hypothetical protein
MQEGGSTYFYYSVEKLPVVDDCILPDWHPHPQYNQPKQKDNVQKDDEVAQGSCSVYWNLCAAMLHLVQAIVVGCLIPTTLDTHTYVNPLYYGRYQVRKSVYLLQHVNASAPASCSDKVAPLLGTEPGDFGFRSAYGLWSSRDDVYPYEHDAFAVPHALFVGYADVRYLILGFFLCSFGFQMLDAVLRPCSANDVPQLVSTTALLRFVEYSVSSSLMLLAIALQVGLTDIYVLTCQFCLMFTTNILGLIAECACNLSTGTQMHAGGGPLLLWVVPHALGWVTCLVAYAPILDAFAVVTRCSTKALPPVVTAVVTVVFVLFNSFGCVQLWHLASKSSLSLSATAMERSSSCGRRDLDRRADAVYVGLSLVAKTALGWLILSPMLHNYVS